MKLIFYLGHNLPCNVIVDFFNRAKHDDLSSYESQLLSSLLSLKLIRRTNANNTKMRSTKKTSKGSTSSSHCYRRRDNHRRFYLIGYVSNDISTRDHEISHALYNLHSEYQMVVSNLYNKTLTKQQQLKIIQCLTRRGYTTDLHQDEYGAYLKEKDTEILKLSGGASYAHEVLCEKFNQCLQQVLLTNIVIDDGNDKFISSNSRKMSAAAPIVLKRKTQIKKKSKQAKTNKKHASKKKKQ